MKSTTKKSAKKATKKAAASKKKAAPNRQWVWTPSTPTTSPMFDVEVALAEAEPKV
jgi:hypothetical protein